MTTHPEDAMTREQMLEEALEQIRATCVGNSPAGCAHDLALKFVLSVAEQALASARPEPAPAADPEEVAKFAFKIACDWGHSQCAPIAADAILKDRALRRYTGDGRRVP